LEVFARFDLAAGLESKDFSGLELLETRFASNMQNSALGALGKPVLVEDMSSCEVVCTQVMCGYHSGLGLAKLLIKQCAQITLVNYALAGSQYKNHEFSRFGILEN